MTPNHALHSDALALGRSGSVGPAALGAGERGR